MNHKFFLITGIAATTLMLGTGCGRSNDNAHTNTNNTSADTAVLTGRTDRDGMRDDDRTNRDTYSDRGWNFDSVNVRMPSVRMPGMNNNRVRVRGNDRYTVYGVDENVLFATNSADISNDGASTLRDVSRNLRDNHQGRQIRVYGYTDRTGSAQYNRDLSERRAQAVQQWLIGQGEISSDNISIHPMGEGNPTGDGDLATDRRVEIVVRRN